MFGRKAAKAADNAATAIYMAGRKVGGKKGTRAAEAVNSALLRREYVECSDPGCADCKARR
ncbi:hypothetical protein [Streptomyces sp. NPDC059176]|uniref:hypothetical protein n=1 Tax=Streptomyces sp. NPDC059176 TaxID=3346758 RepID=UPI0036B34D62